MAKKKKKSGGMGNKPMSEKRFLIEKARSLPIGKCYITSEWEEAGEAQVVVTRERPSGNLCVGVYLCDLWCMGIKDSFGMVNMDRSEFEERFLQYSGMLEECDYVLAHNVIYGAEAFAADAKITADASFDLWQYVLDEDTDDVPLMDIEFGHKGKYHLITETGSKYVKYIHALQERLGDDFIFEVADGNEDSYFDDFDNAKFDGVDE